MTALRSAAAAAALLVCLGDGLCVAQTAPSQTPAAPAAPIPAPPLPGGAPATPPPSWLDTGRAPAASGPRAERLGDAIVLRDVAFATSLGSVEIPRAEIVGSPLSPQEIVALLDPASPTPWSERLASFRASRVDIPELRMKATLDAIASETTYRDIRVEGFADGVLRTVTVRVGASTARNGVETTASETSGMVMSGVNLLGALRLAFEAVAAGGPPVTLYDAYTVERIAFSSAQGSGEMRGVSVAGARMAPTGRALYDVVGGFIALTRLQPNAAGVPPGFPAALASLRDLVAAVELDRMRADSFKMRVEGQATESQIEGLWLRDLRKGRASMGVETLRVAGGESLVTLGGFELIDLDHLWMFGLVANMLEDQSLARDFNPVAFFPSFRRIAIASAISCKPPRCAADEAAFALDGFALDRTPTAEGLDWRFAIKRLATEKTATAAASDGAYSASLAYRREARTLSVSDVTADVKGWGRASVALDVENVMPQLFETRRTAAMIALAPLAARRAQLRLADAGGVDALAARLAEERAQDKARPGGGKVRKPAAEPQGARQRAAARAALAAKLEADIVAKWGEAAPVKAAAKALAAFVRDPASPLTLTAKADPALSVFDFIGGSDAGRALGRVSIGAERR